MPNEKLIYKGPFFSTICRGGVNLQSFFHKMQVYSLKQRSHSQIWVPQHHNIYLHKTYFSFFHASLLIVILKAHQILIVKVQQHSIQNASLSHEATVQLIIELKHAVQPYKLVKKVANVIHDFPSKSCLQALLRTFVKVLNYPISLRIIHSQLPMFNICFFKNGAKFQQGKVSTSIRNQHFRISFPAENQKEM